MSKKARTAAVTINIAMPAELHHRLAIVCAVLQISLKDALMEGVQLLIAKHAATVTEAVPKAVAAREEPAAPELADTIPPSQCTVNGDRCDG